ncbi:two-component system VirA-like sensor kinase [Acidisoma sp.]|uniref:two-component system VirA-like sensor kinase n=1 Tax=Acidisoma sp. TaxID=1872115 RepID=UPI003AFFB663
MRTIGGLAVLAVLLVSWLCFIGTNANTPRDDHAMATLNQFIATGSGLRENILNARLGLLRDYDPVDQEMTQLHQALQGLSDDGVSKAVTAPLEDLIDRQDELTERFKSDNALLQNALAYFGLMSGQAGFAAHGAATNAAIAALSTSVLHLMLDPSPASAEQVQTDLDRLAAQSGPKDADVRNGLLAHGRSLRDLLPATDKVLQALYDLPISAAENTARKAILAQQKDIMVRAGRYRLALYTVSLVLLLLLTLLGLQLRRIMETLRRRAAFEHAMAGISMTFVNARATDLQDVVEKALAELAWWIGAESACFASFAPPQLFTWSRDGRGWTAVQPPSLPDKALPSPEIHYYPVVKRMTAGSEKDALMAAGLSGYLVIPAPGSDALGYTLGFAALTKPMTWPPSDLAPLRMAADNIANAVSRVQLELEHGRLEASLQQARRMETVGALTSGVAHNFNNVIAAILGHTEMQEAEVQAETRLGRHVQGVRQAAERARDLVEQILHFGRRKEPSERRISLSLLLAETEMQLKAALPQSIQLVLDSVPDHAVVRGDPAQLQQIIMNLCNNASQAMGGAGVIRLHVAIRQMAKLFHLSHAELAAGAYVSIAVADTGCGMEAGTLEHLFEPFFTTRAEGHGLGLATAHEIVTSYAGGMNVLSHPGQGSTFEVWLPLVVTGDADSVAPRLSRISGKGETAMIVNEDGSRLLHDEEVVAALGYEPIGYLDPHEAINACRTTPGRFDVILVTNVQSCMPALALATSLHAIAPNLPIILATASDGLSVDALAAAGVSEVIKAPLTSAELASTLPRWVQ